MYYNQAKNWWDANKPKSLPIPGWKKYAKKIAPPKPPDQRAGAKSKWTKVEDKDWSPTVDTNTFLQMVRMTMGYPGNEINSRCRIDEESGAITYSNKKFAVGNSGSEVTMQADMDLELFQEAQEDGVLCNCHWHTHTTMGAFFSPTDDEHQVECLTTENLPLEPDGGTLYFLVIGHLGLDWLMRRFVWFKDEKGDLVIQYSDKHLVIDANGENLILDYGKSRERPASSRQYTTYLKPELGAIQLKQVPAAPTTYSGYGYDEEDYYDYLYDNYPLEGTGSLHNVSDDVYSRPVYTMTALEQEISDMLEDLPEASVLHLYMTGSMPNVDDPTWRDDLAQDIAILAQSNWGNRWMEVSAEAAINENLEEMSFYVDINSWHQDSNGHHWIDGVDVTHYVQESRSQSGMEMAMLIMECSRMTAREFLNSDEDTRLACARQVLATYPIQEK